MTEPDPQDHITHLNGRMVHDRPELEKYAYRPGQPPSPLVEGFFRLSPHARCVYDLHADPRPVMFMAPTPGLPGRCHVVVARDPGDLEWPAYLANLRARAVGETANYVYHLFGPLRTAIAEARHAHEERARWAKWAAAADA